MVDGLVCSIELLILRYTNETNVKVKVVNEASHVIRPIIHQE